MRYSTSVYCEPSEHTFGNFTKWLLSNDTDGNEVKSEEVVNVQCCTRIMFNNQLYKLQESVEGGTDWKMNGANVWRNVDNEDKAEFKKP